MSPTRAYAQISSKSQRAKAPFGVPPKEQEPASTDKEGVGGNAATDSTVVHKDRNGTITVQSTKTVGKSNYSFVSVSPTYVLLSLIQPTFLLTIPSQGGEAPFLKHTPGCLRDY